MVNYTKLWLVFVAIALMVASACVSTSRNAIPQAGWMNNMHRLSAAHLFLYPKAADPKSFADPANRPEIKKHLREMAEAASAVAADPKAPNADPIISFTSSVFAKDVRQAYAAFEKEDYALARFTVARVSQYCISCHTRSDRGIRDFEVGWSSEISRLSSPEKIDFYLANRRYKSAWNEANLSAGQADSVKHDPRAWLKSIKRSMAMVVRVNDDPAQAEQLAYLAFSNKAAPSHLRREAMAWIRDIREWRADKAKHSARDPMLSAVRLVEDRSSFIRSLRASVILHDILEDSRSKRHGEALFYSGIAASALPDFNLGFLDQYYFETCIVESPHSELAERCYGKLEDSVMSANPLLALDPELSMAESARLADLRRIAEVHDSANDTKYYRKEERLDPRPAGK